MKKILVWFTFLVLFMSVASATYLYNYDSICKSYLANCNNPKLKATIRQSNCNAFDKNCFDLSQVNFTGINVIKPSLFQYLSISPRRIAFYDGYNQTDKLGQIGVNTGKGPFAKSLSISSNLHPLYIFANPEIHIDASETIKIDANHIQFGAITNDGTVASNTSVLVYGNMAASGQICDKNGCIGGSSSLAGNGNAYACLDSSGKLFRSNTPCTSISESGLLSIKMNASVRRGVPVTGLMTIKNPSTSTSCFGVEVVCRSSLGGGRCAQNLQGSTVVGGGLGEASATDRESYASGTEGAPANGWSTDTSWFTQFPNMVTIGGSDTLTIPVTMLVRTAQLDTYKLELSLYKNDEGDCMEAFDTNPLAPETIYVEVKL